MKFQNIREFSGFIRPHSSLFFQAILGSFVIDILALSLPLFMKVLVDNIIVYENIGLLNAIVIAIVILFLFKTIFGLLKNYIMLTIGVRVDADVSIRFYRSLQNLPFSFYEKMKVGEMQSRLIDVNIIQNSISGIILSVVIDGLAIILFVAVLLYLNWQLTIFSFIFVPILILTILIFAEPLKKGAEKVMALRAEYMSFVYESLAGIRTIKALNLTNKFSRLTKRRLLSLNREEFRLSIISFFSSSIGEIAQTLGGILILWFGARLVIQGNLTLGGLLAFYALLDHLMRPLYNFTELNEKAQTALAATQRFYEIYNIKPTIVDTAYAIELPQEIKGDIQFKDVFFSYNGKDDVIKGITLNIPAQKVTAIVGKSGAGKTTLCNLIVRFYDPYLGSIFIDEHNIKDIKLNNLRSQIGLITQEPFLFSGSVRENILIAVRGKSTEEMVKTAKIVDLHDFIMSLPEKYETKIGERGINLSGGQKQRLVLARTIIQKPRVLIMDEATSSLDVQSEAVIQKALKMLGKITLIIVTHRLSAIRNADNIVVLDNGKVSEIGKHEELISQKGVYYNLNQYTRDDQLCTSA